MLDRHTKMFQARHIDALRYSRELLEVGFPEVRRREQQRQFAKDFKRSRELSECTCR